MDTDSSRVESAANLSGLRGSVLALVAAAESEDALEQLRTELLGKKGQLTQAMKELGSLPVEQRKEAGQSLNLIKSEVEQALSQRIASCAASRREAALQSEWVDVTLPVNAPLFTTTGTQHCLTRVRRELEEIFRSMGFTVVDGPEVEKEYYNFEALNIPATHPARDMQDTIWTTDGNLLRTHTSAMQVRALERLEPPLRIVGPGRCFRYERLDASHEHTFYQMEGMMIDRDVSIPNLIYFMKRLLREIFGSEQKIRLRPGYFPFVEPGFELDIWFQGRWLELLPCGLVHPRVLESSGIDSTQWQGFAFGLGLSRLVMTRYQIDDIRYFQSCDLRFLKQFA